MLKEQCREITSLWVMHWKKSVRPEVVKPCKLFLKQTKTTSENSAQTGKIAVADI